MGSKKQEPEWKMPPDATGPSQNLSSVLGQVGGQYRAGQTPFMSSLGQGTLDELLMSGLPIDASPLMAQAGNMFNSIIAPSIQGRLGANYGIRFGTPVADLMSRSGGDVAIALNAELARYADMASQRRMQAIGLQQNAFMNALQALIGGAGTFRQGSGFYQPQYAQSTGGQLLGAAGTLGGAFLGGPAGAAMGTAITQGYLGSQQGKG